MMSFWPVGKVISIGKQRPLELDDLWSIKNSEKSEFVWRKLNYQWEKQQAKSKPSLMRAVFSAFSSVFIYSILLQCLYAILSFVTPVLLPFIIEYLQFDGKRQVMGFTVNEIPAWHGIIYSLTVVLATLMASVAMFHSQMLMWSFGLQMRSALLVSMYKKSLRIAASEIYDTGQVVNMISTDAQLFLDSVLPFVQGIVAPLQIVITTILLYIQIQYYCFIPIGIFIVSIPINNFIISLVKSFRKKIQGISDVRIKYLQELIDSIKTLKFYGWQDPHTERVSMERKREVRTIKRMLLWRSFMIFLMLNVPTLGLGITFIVYSLSNELTVTIVFTTISLTQLLRSSFVAMPLALSYYGQYHVAFKRIQEYLLKPNMKSFKCDKLEPGLVAVLQNVRVSFHEDKQSNCVFDKVNLKVKAGELIMIVGAVGSGKTTLCRVLLREIDNVEGDVKIGEHIAYASQDAWIVSGTIRENILFGLDYNHERYQHILYICALERDIERMPGGDQAEIGEKGANLSGGQRQRISLARALYSDRKFLILDDPFSALDAHVAKHIFSKAIVQAHEDGKTIIIVTNQLNNLQFADRIIYIKNNNLSAETLETHLANNKDFCDLVCYGVIENKEGDQEENITMVRKASLIKSLYGESFRRAVVNPDNQDAQLVQKEEKLIGSISLGQYWYYFKTGSLFRFAIYLLAVIIRSVARVAGIIWIANWSSDDVNNPQYSKDVYLYVYLGLVLTEALFTWAYSSLLALFSAKASRRFHKRLLYSVVEGKTTFFDRTPIGRLISRFSKDISLIDIPLPNNVEHLVSNIFTLIGIIVSIAFGNPYILIAVGVAMVMYVLLSIHYRSSAIQIQRLEAVSRSPIFSHFAETLSGVDTIRAFQKEVKFNLTNAARIDENTVAYLSVKRSAMWFGLRLDWLGSIILVATYIAIVVTRNLTIIDVALASLALSSTTSISAYLAGTYTLLTETDVKLNAMERVRQYYHIDKEEPGGQIPDSDWPMKGKIQFKNVSVHYSTNNKVLKSLSLTVKSGEKIGVVGRTGAGKSTLSTSLFRSVELSEGEILVDDVNIAEIDLNELRRRISYIPQTPVIFTGSVRFNLDPYLEKTEDEIWMALRKAELMEFVNALPNKLDEIVDGQVLSIGQKQLLSLARCFLSGNKIIVIDEATASVDMETNASIQRMIRKYFKDKTIITVAHLLHTIMDYDRIMVMDGGSIIEMGVPSELLENPRGHLSRLVKATGKASSQRLTEIANGIKNVTDTMSLTNSMVLSHRKRSSSLRRLQD